VVKNSAIFFNIIGCIIAGYFYFYILLYSERPLTLDIIFSIFQAELCRWVNARRRQHPDLQPQNDDNLGLLEKGHSGQQKLDCLAAIVGYREDPELFARALESYVDAQNCKFILVCIDGDAEEDQEMINVFRNVSA
jgi:hyaluronan synthase